MLKFITQPRTLISMKRLCGLTESSLNRSGFECRRLFSRLEDDPDTFGNIEKTTRKFDLIEDDNDAQDEHEAKVADIHRPGKSYFLKKINDLIHIKKDLRSALNVLETDMKEEYVRPDQPHYRVVINACAKAGHVKKAFQLFREFKERGLPRHIGIYSDLFSACTRTKDRVLGLEKATGLLNELREKHFNPNRVLYNSMIQAFGRCGDLKTAFNLVDEMKEQKYSLNSETFNFLIQGCLSDKESGFRHALLVWRNLRRKNISPDIHTYNLVLRCANECKLGDFNQLQDILLETVPLKERSSIQSRIEAQQIVKSLEEGDMPQVNWLEIDLSSFETETTGSLSKIEVTSALPSLLEVTPNLQNVLSLELEDTPFNRLMLLGGPERILSVMKGDKVSADLKTLSLLLMNDNTLQQEQTVLEIMESQDIKPDIAFYNQLIKQRALRKDYVAGIETLAEISRHSLSPDIITFGVLAMCCSTRKSGLKLISDIRNYGAKPNTEIMGALISGAISRWRPGDVKFYLEIAAQENVLINQKVLNNLESFISKFRGYVKTKEEGGYVPYPILQEHKKDYKNWRAFTNYYKDWLMNINFEESVDPMEQYETTKDKQRSESLKPLKTRESPFRKERKFTRKYQSSEDALTQTDEKMEGFTR